MPNAEPQLILMKCCGRRKHNGKCVEYWHKRQREEVRKRVEGEKEMNKQMLANESKLFATFEAKEIDMAHDHALELEWRHKASEVMRRFVKKCDDGKAHSVTTYQAFRSLLE